MKKFITIEYEKRVQYYWRCKKFITTLLYVIDVPNVHPVMTIFHPRIEPSLNLRVNYAQYNNTQQ